MNQEVQKFFEKIIGYNGKNWSIDHAGKHQQGGHSWFLYDMEKMIKNEVGSPSFLYLMNTIAYLGCCAKFGKEPKDFIHPKDKQKRLSEAGEMSDFIHFCERYLKPVNKAYSILAHLLFTLGRHRLSHVFFTTGAITTYPSSEHLKIIDRGSQHPYIFISVADFFEDTKKAIEFLHKELYKDPGKSDRFLETQKFLLNWSWKQNSCLNNIDLENNLSEGKPSSSSGASGPCYPPHGGISGVPYTPPPL